MTPLFKVDPTNLHWVVRDDLEGYNLLATRLRSLIGVDMQPTEKNRVLMACRLAPLLKRKGCKNYGEYVQLLSKGDAADTRDFISALTTHTTEFYRESKHFDLFSAILPILSHQKRADITPELRVWCAAASSGQEPYTILFSLFESFPTVRRWNLKFLASDIDRIPLLKGQSGQYTSHEMRKVPELVRTRYFDRRKGLTSDIHTVKPAYRKLITFAEFNLAREPYPFKFPFDIVFCRNVLIYFDLQSGAQVIERIVDAMRPGAFLFVGHAETGFVRSRRLRTIAPAVFQKI